MRFINYYGEQISIETFKHRLEDSFWGHLGCKLEHLDQDEVVLSLEIKKHHLNLIGIVHGGVTSALVDNAMSLVVILSRPRQVAVTTNLNIQYLSSVKEGKIYASAKIVESTPKLSTVSCLVKNEAGDIVVMGYGTFRVVKEVDEETPKQQY